MRSAASGHVDIFYLIRVMQFEKVRDWGFRHCARTQYVVSFVVATLDDGDRAQTVLTSELRSLFPALGSRQRSAVVTCPEAPGPECLGVGDGP